jgi:quercetin 2,3-dioxygenase
MAEDRMPRGAFSVHPHRCFETVTVVIEGSVEHSDSAGHGGVIHAGDARGREDGRPAYQDLVSGATPVRRKPGIKARVFSGTSGGVTSPTLNHVPVTMLDVQIEPGASFRQFLPASDNAFVYVLAGAPKIGDAGTLVQVSRARLLQRCLPCGFRLR